MKVIDVIELGKTAKLYAEKHTMFFPDMTLLRVGQAKAFEAGAEWGYAQALKDIWHNVKDEKPELRRTVICVNELVVEAELYTDNNELDEIEHYTKWCYLDDILPKE